MSMLYEALIRNEPELFQKQLQKQHCGLIAATYTDVLELMPDVYPILCDLPSGVLFSDYLFDIKVHMLMPGQWPCVPNWHCDFVPRDDTGKLLPHLIQPGEPPMFMWVSGDPYTEFMDGPILPRQWRRFTRRDKHRGVKAKRHIWRLFLRAAPREFFPERVLKLPKLRRHAQVYIEPDFTW